MWLVVVVQGSEALDYSNSAAFIAVFFNCSVVSNSFAAHGLKPTTLLCPWDFPGKNTRVDCHFLLQEISLTQGSIHVSCTAGRFVTAKPPGELRAASPE